MLWPFWVETMHTQTQTELAARALAIRRAATMMGGLEHLAERLKLPERQLDYWMRDIGTPPDTVFFDVIDIIIERAGKPAPTRTVYKTAA
jgi:hypothetical protein